jgi:hypothetical protein
VSQAHVEVLHTSDCPDWQAVRERIEASMQEEAAERIDAGLRAALAG